MTDLLIFDELAALDALGILGTEDRAEYGRLLAASGVDGRLRSTEYREAATMLALALDPVAPPESVKNALLKALPKIPQRSITIRETDGRWGSMGVPGVDIKKLSEDYVRNTVTLLMRFAPNSVVPAHGHQGREQCFVVSGSCSIGGVSLSAGDYHEAEEGTEHGAVVSGDAGCLLLLIVEREDAA